MNEDPFASFPPGFPRPDWDAATLQRVVDRRKELKKGCPWHGDPVLTFYKELFVSDPQGGHLPTMAVYQDGCMAKWRLDVEHEETPTFDKVNG
jgi:hypothetical protein